jgi:hypothetical protein
MTPSIALAGSPDAHGEVRELGERGDAPYIRGPDGQPQRGFGRRAFFGEDTDFNRTAPWGWATPSGTAPTPTGISVSPCGQITITLSNGATVVSPLNSPTLTIANATVTAGLGGAFSNSVTAGGSPSSIVWRDPTGAIQGSGTSISLNATAQMYGQWTITATNCAGSTTTNFTLYPEIGTPVMITPLAVSPAVVHSGKSGGPYATYALFTCQFYLNPSDLPNFGDAAGIPAGAFYIDGGLNPSVSYPFPGSGQTASVGMVGPSGGSFSVYSISGNIVSFSFYAVPSPATPAPATSPPDNQGAPAPQPGLNMAVSPPSSGTFLCWLWIALQLPPPATPSTATTVVVTNAVTVSAQNP